MDGVGPCGFLQVAHGPGVWDGMGRAWPGQGGGEAIARPGQARPGWLGRSTVYRQDEVDGGRV